MVKVGNFDANLGSYFELFFRMQDMASLYSNVEG